MNNINLEPEQIDYILSAQAVRERAHMVLELCRSGKGRFNINDDRLAVTADYVIEVIKKKYPELNIPYHSRWSHFQVGGRDRLGELETKLVELSPEGKAKVKIDLVVASVLLDAGAGAAWRYHERETGGMYSRSEGLAVASFNMFMNGDFSTDDVWPLQADSKGLLTLTEEALKKGFQVSVGNTLFGVPGRLKLLQSLGKAVKEKAEYFAGETGFRPGNIVDYLLRVYPDKKIPAVELLKTVLLGFGDIWPSRLSANGVNLGDTWVHTALGEEESFESLVPIHKLSQWLTYSLLEPLEEMGFEILDLNGLTALAEYRNGGLLVDMGLIELKDKSQLEVAHRPDSQVIIEWRALTLALMYDLADVIRTKLSLSKEDFPLAKILEGGTWWAGRKIAKEKRESGDPPIQILSDGTVF